jgi:uncharacterized Zn-binding protein involved in type VI secretion
MAGIVRSNLDTAAGLVQASAQSLVRLDGFFAAVVGTHVAIHGLGAHFAATLPTGSTFLRIDGVAVVLAGMSATCGHVPTGSAVVSASN